jgi:hypothetical protein
VGGGKFVARSITVSVDAAPEEIARRVVGGD